MTDAGYGDSADFRDGVAARGLVYVAGVTEDIVALADEPTWLPLRPPGRGRPATRHRPAADQPPPVALSELAKRLRPRTVAWREGPAKKVGARA